MNLNECGLCPKWVFCNNTNRTEIPLYNRKMNKKRWTEASAKKLNQVRSNLVILCLFAEWHPLDSRTHDNLRSTDQQEEKKPANYQNNNKHALLHENIFAYELNRMKRKEQINLCTNQDTRHTHTHTRKEPASQPANNNQGLALARRWQIIMLNDVLRCWNV